MATERNDYITGLVHSMYREGMPEYLVDHFVDEAAAHPDEYPTITRDVNEVYPDPAAWAAKVRRKEPGILHWQWADGSGFPPHKEPSYEPSQ